MQYLDRCKTQHAGHQAVGDLIWSPYHDLVHEQPLSKKMTYSDLNFILLGLILEYVTGQSLEHAIRLLVLDPLHLDQTTYAPDPIRCVATETGNSIERGMVNELGLTYTGWRPDEAIQGQCNDGNAFYYFHGIAGHAGLFSTAEDLLTFGRAFCTPDESFLSHSLVAIILRDRGDDRMYGFQCGSLYPGGGFGHTGFTGSYVYVQPELDIIITVLTNRLHDNPPKNVNRFRTEVVNTLLRQLFPGRTHSL